MITIQETFDAELLAKRNTSLRELGADLDTIEGLILALADPTVAVERGRRLARIAHSIKGIAGRYGLDLISVAVHRMEDDMAIQDLVDGENDKYVERMLKHKERLVKLVEAYFNDDQQVLADMQPIFARAPAAPALEPDAAEAASWFRVLLVDSSRATLKVCVDVLNELGVEEVATEQDGYEALGRLLKEPFDAVITALHVPTIGGHSLMPALRTIPGPNQMTPVILLTPSAADLVANAVRPDYIVETNLKMTQRLKRILSELKDAARLGAPLVWPKIDRVLKKIVLVDDSPTIHQLLRISFKRFKHIQIASLEDPTTAVAFVRNERPDLVLLDLNMPKLSGKDVIREIKMSADLQDIPVAFLTAADTADEREELFGLGAWQVFKKPFVPKTFADELLQIYKEA